MRFTAALELLLDGKKIRCESWGKPSETNAVFVDCSMPHITFSTNDMYQQWEVYEEPTLRFSDVLKGLKEGRSYRRNEWPPTVDYIDCPEQYLRSVCGNNKHIASLCIEDFEATDWVQVR